MKFIKRFFNTLCVLCGVFVPNAALAGWGILSVDSLDISKLVPIILDSFMFVANGTYSYFVGENHDGLIFTLIWGFFALYIAIYLIKLFVPKFWINTFGFKPDESITNTSGMKIAETLLKPSLRVVIAVLVFLPMRPEFLTKNLINPFLKFGSIYTTEIIKISSANYIGTGDTSECPESLLNQGWLDAEACSYVIQPVHELSRANNTVIKRGFRYLSNGLTALSGLMLHNGGQGFMNLITGILLICTFTMCNIFMALVVIQAIFNFGMALILYPFTVAAWVVKKSKSWFDIWPAFSGIIEALKQIVVAMIACAFILCVNLALVAALTQWNGAEFNAAAGGTAYSNVPNVTSFSTGFGEHSLLWLSCLLTYFLMRRIFQITQAKLTEYVGKDSTALFEQVKGDAKTTWNIANAIPGKVKGVWGALRGN